MGDYTSLRIKIQVKPEFLEIYQALLELRRNREQAGGWEQVSRRFPQHEFIADWAQIWRADFIPFGGLTNGWDAEDAEWKTRIEGDILIWQFSIKNYEHEIAIFVGKFKHTWLKVLELHVDSDVCGQASFTTETLGPGLINFLAWRGDPPDMPEPPSWYGS